MTDINFKTLSREMAGKQKGSSSILFDDNYSGSCYTLWVQQLNLTML